MMLKLTLIFLLLINTGELLSQEFDSKSLYDSYHKYKEHIFDNSRINHSILKSRIDALSQKDILDIQVVGKSLENREIYKVSIGSGKINVLLWSQMHGDESTATMALFDLFNFFIDKNDFNDLKDQLLKNVTLHFIPMLNPDGAESFKRRNALDIDLNRDAIRLEFPESKILKTLQQEINPKFAFNLHDQNTRYTAGQSYRSATISFLAPAFNFEKDIDSVRENTMKVIVDIFNDLKRYIPGHIAKYKDDFEPRAFGDNFIKWGTSSVLIESGGWKNDEEKQFIRKLNFLAILMGINSIANDLYKKADVSVYHQIPFNDNLLFDLLLRNLKIEYKGKEYKIDVGINRNENSTKDLSKLYYSGTIEDWGDLSIFYGYDELNLENYMIEPAKILSLEASGLESLNCIESLKNGYGFIAINSATYECEYSSLPFNIILNGVDIDTVPKYSGFANFTIWKDNKIAYSVINGFLYDFSVKLEKFGNGLIFK